MKRNKIKKSLKLLALLLSVLMAVQVSYAVDPEPAQAGILSFFSGDEEYTVTLNDAEHGSLSFSEGDGSFAKGDIVLVTSDVDDGFTLSDFSAIDENGNVIEHKIRPDAVTFTMPEGNVTVSAVFTLNDELIFRDVTDEQGITKKDMAETVTDPVLENYLRENTDPEYTLADKTEIADIMVVKQTLFDRSLLEKDDTMESILCAMEDGDGEAADKYITQLQNIVAVYNLSDDSDYYAASVNTMRDDENVDSRDDVVFALTDNDANVLDDCHYDAGTGIAYIPKADFLNEDGEEVLMNVQVQMMQAVDYDAADSEVLAAVGDEDTLESASVTTAGFFDLETTVQTDAGMDEDDLSVSVNGVPVEKAAYEYDSESGELTIAQSSAVIQSVYVTQEESTVFEKVSELLAPSLEAYAASYADMVYTAYNIKLPDWVVDGTLLTGTAGYSYNGRSTWYNSYGYGSASTLISLIDNGGSLDQSKITSQDGGLNNIFVWLEDNTLQNSGRTVPALSGITGALHMDCAHVSSPLGTVTGAAVNGGRVSQQKTRLRFLHVDRDEGYAVFGVYTVTTHTQTGSGLFKIGIVTEPDETPNVLKASYTARDAYSPSLDIHIEKADADTGEKLQGAEFTVYMDGTKLGTVITDANGRASYHWRGDILYTGYSTASKEYVTNYSKISAANKANYAARGTYANVGAAYKAAKSQVLSDVAGKLASLKSSTKHTWRVVETKAPEGYELNPEAWEQTLSAGDAAAIELDFTNVPSTGKLNLKKESGSPSLTENNPCYSLEGAEYGIYSSLDDAKNDVNRKAILITDADGNTETITVRTGTYYVKEVTASKGFKLCDGSDGAGDGIHEVTVKKGETATVKCKELPANAPFALNLQKMDFESGKPKAQGIASLGGAIFAVEYYTNTDGTVSGTPYRTWYFRTDEDGCLDCQKESYFIASYIMEEGTVLKSDHLYKDSSGKVVYPLGTYRIREISPPMYYQNVGYMQFEQNPTGQASVILGLKAVIKQNENGGDAHIYNGEKVTTEQITAENPVINAYDKPQYGSITIYKRKADGSKEPIPGVTFKLAGMEEGDEYTATTDAEGKIVWNDLIPQNYVITEVSTVDGYNLLKDNIEVRLPMEMTLDELNKNSADRNKAIYDEATGMYCFYDLTFIVDDSVEFKMPFTGADQNMLYIIFVVALSMTALGIILMFRKKKGLFWKK